MSVTEFVTTARKVGGALKIRSLDHLTRGLEAMPDGEYLVTISRPRATRSARLNRLYWAGYIRPFCERTGFTPMEMHAYFKHKFLGQKRLVLADDAGEVLDDVALDAVTTTTLTEQEFKDYLREIEALAVRCNVSVGSHHD